MLKKNVGEMYFKTEAKGGSIQTEMNYDTNPDSENSLMYFFDLFDEVFKNKEAEKKENTL
jgi:phosphomevalonate kinase